jgi:hypothetical protein
VCGPLRVLESLPDDCGDLGDVVDVGMQLLVRGADFVDAMTQPSEMGCLRKGFRSRQRLGFERF